jgi:hypothetical protein
MKAKCIRDCYDSVKRNLYRKGEEWDIDPVTPIAVHFEFNGQVVEEKPVEKPAEKPMPSTIPELPKPRVNVRAEEVRKAASERMKARWDAKRKA